MTAVSAAALVPFSSVSSPREKAHFRALQVKPLKWYAKLPKGQPRSGEHHGTAGDDPRPRAVPRRPYPDHAADFTRARDRRDGRGRLQDRLRAGLAVGLGADRPGFFRLSRDGVDRRLVSAEGAETHHRGADAVGSKPVGGGASACQW